METIGAFEAKTHLSALLDRAAQGESFTITKRGKPVATLGPAPSASVQPMGPKDIIMEFRRLHGKSIKKVTLAEIKEWKELGRH